MINTHFVMNRQSALTFLNLKITLQKVVWCIYLALHPTTNLSCLSFESESVLSSSALPLGSITIAWSRIVMLKGLSV